METKLPKPGLVKTVRLIQASKIYERRMQKHTLQQLYGLLIVINDERVSQFLLDHIV